MNFKKITPKQFSNSLFNLNGISKKTVEEHLKLYQGYVNKYNEINEKIVKLEDEDFSKGNQVYSKIRELKIESSFAYGGVVNHELYFSQLGYDEGTTSGRVPTGTLLKQIDIDFGSFENYKKDLRASGLSARGWVWTGWNIREKRLFNHIGDSQNTYLIWGVVPIIAMDTYEHAYFIDYGTDRGGYIGAFFDNLNWSLVGNRFESIKSCKCGDECDCS
jgi:Fe-Mn family superoxide dismutase